MQKLKRLSMVVLCLALLLPSFTSCKKSSQSQSFYYMDTVIAVTLYNTDKKTAAPLFQRCDQLLSELDALWSRTSQTGEVYRLCRDGVIETPDARTVTLLQDAKRVSEWSQGAYDITIAPMVDLWNTCAEEDRVPTADELQKESATVNSNFLTITNDKITLSSGSIDLGGIGKGAAAELILELLREAGVPGGFVSFGSNVAMFGEKPDRSAFRVAIKDPQDSKASVGTLLLSAGEILSVSGDYERYHTIQGKQYHHILNPKTGMPAESGLHSVAVIAADGAIADALSTALFVMGEDAATEFYHSGQYRFEAIFCTTSGEVHVTPGLQDKFIQNN